MKTTFTKEELLEILYESNHVVLDEITDTGRWSIHHDLIFKKDDKLYQTTYSVGATESQDEQPWEYEDFVTCTEVEAYYKTVTAYKEIK